MWPSGGRPYRLVFDGGAGDTQVELPILLHAGLNQSLHWTLLLEQQECVTWKTGHGTHEPETVNLDMCSIINNHLKNTASSLKWIISWYLLVGSRICSLLYGASPQPGGQSGESLRLFHLGGRRGGDFKTSDEEQRQKRARPKKLAASPSPSSMSGGKPPTNTLREKRSIRSPFWWG